MNSIPVRVGLIQRVLPEYRVAFFEMLAGACPKGFCLFAGRTQPGEGILETSALLHGEFYPAENRYLVQGRRYLVWQKNIVQWLESWQPEVLIAEANPRLINVQRAITWMHKHNRKVIGWGLGMLKSESLGWLRKPFNRNFIRKFDGMLSYSAAGKEAYKELGFPADRIFIAPNAVSAKPGWYMPVRKEDFSAQGPIILFVGRLVEQKRVDALIQACATLVSKSAVRLVIVGDGPARESLEKLAADVFPRAEFKGDLRGKALEAEYRRADLFVLPGLGGLAIQQAMSFGLPIIAAQADGTQADLVRPQNGCLVNTGDVEELSRVLLDAISDIKQLRLRGEASFRIVSQEINLENMVENFKLAIESVSKTQQK